MRTSTRDALFIAALRASETVALAARTPQAPQHPAEGAHHHRRVGLNTLPPEGGRLRARLKIAHRAACGRQCVQSHDRGPHDAHVLTAPKPRVRSEQLNAEGLKAGEMKPGTSALKTGSH